VSTGKEQYTEISDEELMKGICNSDKDAFNELYKRYNGRLLYYFYRMLGNSEEKAQDLLQDIFLKIIEKPHLFDVSRKFSTWIFSIAHNMCKNEYRSRDVRKIVENKDNVETLNNKVPCEDIDLRIFTGELYKELDKLSEDQKTIFILRYREGFKVKEISNIVKRPEGTVKSKLFYTIRILSEKLKYYKSNLKDVSW